MSTPITYRAFRRSPGENTGTVYSVIEEMPPLQSNDVLIRIHAVSLNYRDVAMLHGKYPIPVKEQGIPASDCAGEVVAVGPRVNKALVGDRVAPIFDLKYIEGVDPLGEVSHLGGNIDGVLREYAIFDENVLVHLPQHLSWEETGYKAACITCAGTTAWNALHMSQPEGRPRSALMLGTGGVSMFALSICLAGGVRPIITSSSDTKLREILSLGAKGSIDVINYRNHPEWDQEVLRLTDGKGVDVILETVGGTSIQQSVACAATRGSVSWIGFLGGWELDGFMMALKDLFLKAVALQPIQIGSKLDQARLCEFLQEKKISLKHIVGKTFAFEESAAALDYLYSGRHTGKVVITI